MRFFHVLVLVALVLSGASPACEFISGKKRLIEICAADGTLKTVAVDAGQTPDEKTHEAKHKSSQDCAFCFSQAHSKSLKSSSFIVNAKKTFIIPEAGFYSTLKINTYQTAQARAPPAILS